MKRGSCESRPGLCGYLLLQFDAERGKAVLSVACIFDGDGFDIPDVIATASEPTKVGGILGALRTGTIDTLATTESIAETVLGLDQSRRAGGN